LGAIGQDPNALEGIDASDPLLAEGIEEMGQLLDALDSLGLSDQVRFDPSLARGLDIYTGTVYEFFQVNGTISSSLASGGRYDRIIGEFLGDGKIYPAVGLSLGLDVIYTALQDMKGRDRKPPVDLYLIPLGTTVASLKLARELRDAGLKVDVDLTERKIGKRFRYADKEGIPYVVVLGENEIASGKLTVKEMTTGEELVVERAALVDVLSRRTRMQSRANGQVY
jgi:histidyl-tRNA synthetase